MAVEGVLSFLFKDGATDCTEESRFQLFFQKYF